MPTADPFEPPTASTAPVEARGGMRYKRIVVFLLLLVIAPAIIGGISGIVFGMAAGGLEGQTAELWESVAVYRRIASYLAMFAIYLSYCWGVQDYLGRHFFYLLGLHIVFSSWDWLLPGSDVSDWPLYVLKNGLCAALAFGIVAARRRSRAT